MSAGYSGTPLAKKLGIKEGHQVGTFNAPPHFPALLESLPDDVEIEPEPVGKVALDVAILFVTDEGELRARFAEVARCLRPNGGLWVSWPKKSSPLATDLRDSHVRTVGLAAGLVDNKVCAIDQDWSGLRFVYRLSDR
jgi:hypothetical protein